MKSSYYVLQVYLGASEINSRIYVEKYLLNKINSLPKRCFYSITIKESKFTVKKHSR